MEVNYKAKQKRGIAEEYFFFECTINGKYTKISTYFWCTFKLILGAPGLTPLNERLLFFLIGVEYCIFQ